MTMADKCTLRRYALPSNFSAAAGTADADTVEFFSGWFSAKTKNTFLVFRYQNKWEEENWGGIR